MLNSGLEWCLRELWIGVIEVLTEPNGGNTRALTNVIAWADSSLEYERSVSEMLEGRGWTVLKAENVRPVSQESNYREEIAEIIERARSIPDACIFATLHYYPSRPA
jgi:hypothetical protein